MTREQLGRGLRLTTEHGNRSIKSLEQDGLVKHNERTVTFPNVAALHEAGDFNPEYLRLDQPPMLA